jgi:hypothetical protein
MEYAALALAVLGLVLGLAFRLKVLLLFLAMLVIVSAVFAVRTGWGFPGTLLTILVVQSIVQASYFAGVVGRSMMADRFRIHPIFDKTRVNGV